MTTAGTAFIWAAFIAVLASIALYVGSLREREPNAAGGLRPIARGAFFLAVLCVVGASAIHSTLLMTHAFDVNYVYRYSSRELSRFYLFSTFWAGQEGSFLLWAFWTSVLGVFLAVKSGKLMERRVMPIYGGVLGFILLLLIVKSPFVPYAPATPMDPVHPTNGMGLNPLLENPWMVVHPPTLFLGFASLAATFSFALAALFFGDFDHWFRRTWPWALFSLAVLGFGVMLGGYWAYDTLGWGGFWGWDPVENGPLVPWLGMVAFSHAAQVQRVRGSLKKTTLFLGLFPFVAALYETFLTRTGILDKFSNHSFSTLGGVANSIILWGLAGSLALSLLFLAFRSRKIKNESSAWENATSREFGMTLAIIVIMACAVITGIGMSAPLITQAGVDWHLIARQSSVATGFYNKANFPIAILLTAGMAIGPYLSWKATRGAQMGGLTAAYVVSVVAAIAFYLVSSFLGHFTVHPAMVLLFTACVFGAVANAQILVARLAPSREPTDGSSPAPSRTALRTAGGYFAHIGAALLLLGVVLLVTYTRKDDPILAQGHPTILATLPYTMTYLGMTQDPNHRDNQLKFAVVGEDGKRGFTAMMPYAIRDVEGTMEPLARPAIFHRWWGDLYFALKDGPEQISLGAIRHFDLTRGQSSDIGGYRVFFQGFSVPPDVAAMVKQGMMPAVFPVTAVMQVTTPDGRTLTERPMFIQKRNDPSQPESPEVALPPLPAKDSLTTQMLMAGPHVALDPHDVPRMALAFDQMDADSGKASFYIRDASVAPVTVFTIEVSTRPGIGLVWLGTVLIAFGGLLSMRRRALENRLVPVPDPSPRAAEKAPARDRRRARTESRKPAPAMKGGH